MLKRALRRFLSSALCLLVSVTGSASVLAADGTAAAPVSLPSPTTDKIIQPVEEGDVFSQRVMLYWEALPDAHHYGMEAYEAADTGEGALYTLAASRDAFTTSGTLTGLKRETRYAVVVKAYDKHSETLAVYEYVAVTTAAADPYVLAGRSNDYLRDPVYYPGGQNGGNASSSPSGQNGRGMDWWVIALIIEATVVVACGLTLVLWIRKKRKNQKV